MKEIIANEEIRAHNVRLVKDDGSTEVLPRSKAQSIANNSSLDLVQVSDSTGTPVVKIVSLNKYKYELQQNEKKSKKAQRASAVQQKEIQFKTGIQEHDLNVKVKNAVSFLDDGKQVRMVLSIQGRRGKTDAQVSAQNTPYFDTVLQKLGEIDVIQKVQLSGNKMHCVIRRKVRQG